ncbi:MAG: hypothetical protein HAW67_02350 [Endozoicomonadaceae bacterium]|nr:hypothetical protein [Endozoicomonadaceae bacterium]
MSESDSVRIAYGYTRSAGYDIRQSSVNENRQTWYESGVTSGIPKEVLNLIAIEKLKTPIITNVDGSYSHVLGALYSHRDNIIYFKDVKYIDDFFTGLLLDNSTSVPTESQSLTNVELLHFTQIVSYLIEQAFMKSTYRLIFKNGMAYASLAGELITLEPVALPKNTTINANSYSLVIDENYEGELKLTPYPKSVFDNLKKNLIAGIANAKRNVIALGKHESDLLRYLRETSFEGLPLSDKNLTLIDLDADNIVSKIRLKQKVENSFICILIKDEGCEKTVTKLINTLGGDYVKDNLLGAFSSVEAPRLCSKCKVLKQNSAISILEKGFSISSGINYSPTRISESCDKCFDGFSSTVLVEDSLCLWKEEEVGFLGEFLGEYLNNGNNSKYHTLRIEKKLPCLQTRMTLEIAKGNISVGDAAKAFR